MKRILLFLTLLFSCATLQSCYTERTAIVSCINDFERAYIGKSKSYIIENFPFTITNVRHIDSNYEILVFVRPRNYYVGDGYTYFHMKDGVCYRIETNEYKTVEVKQ